LTSSPYHSLFLNSSHSPTLKLCQPLPSTHFSFSVFVSHMHPRTEADLKIYRTKYYTVKVRSHHMQCVVLRRHCGRFFPWTYFPWTFFPNTYCGMLRAAPQRKERIRFERTITLMSWLLSLEKLIINRFFKYIHTGRGGVQAPTRELRRSWCRPVSHI